MPPLFVLDASTLLTVLLREPCAPSVEELLLFFANGKIDLVEPTLWQYEIANTLYQKAHHFPDRRQMLHIYTRLHDIGFASRDPEPKEIEQAFAILAATDGQTYYDAIYHAMAIVQRGTLVTADRRYAKAAAKWGRLLMVEEIGPLLNRLRR